MVNGSHAYARRARFQPQFCFFAVTSVTHEEKRAKTRRVILQNGRMEHEVFNVVSIRLCVLYLLVC